MSVKERLISLSTEMKKWRHYLHAHPETAYEEHNTAAFIADILKSFGIEVNKGLAKTGIVGILKKGDGPVIGLRTDMDALDITEENTFAYRSQNEGKMHACGHDGHIAMMLGAAKYLSQNDTFQGTVCFIFQPAEENKGGGRKMVEDGLFNQFPIEAVYGMHNFPFLEEGTFAICSGPMMAACDIFEITVKGVGTHGGMPYMGKDSIVAASHMVTMFQSIISRNLNALDSAVISITQFIGGSTWNVLPETVTLRGTIRTFSESVQQTIELRMREIIRGIEISFGIEAELNYIYLYPATVNHGKETENAVRAAINVAGSENVQSDFPPITGSEDFSFFLKEKPGSLIGIGSGKPGQDLMLHQPLYDFNDNILPLGAGYWVSLAEMLLPKK